MNNQVSAAALQVSREATSYAVNAIAQLPSENPATAMGLLFGNLNVMVMTRFVEECAARDVPGAKELLAEMSDK